jgi:hypothetical protein
MSNPADVPDPAYHLFLDSDEAAVAAHAVRLFLSDEAHEAGIRQIARESLAVLQATPDEGGRITVPLTAEQMKIIHSAARLLLNDLQRDQASQRAILRSILDKLPDEHTMRAITLP